jgi:hypothetical protein
MSYEPPPQRPYFNPPRTATSLEMVYEMATSRPIPI